MMLKLPPQLNLRITLIMRNSAFTFLLLLAVSPAMPADQLPENPVLRELLEKGVTMSDGKAYKLPPSAMGEGLSAAEQKAVIEKIGKAKRYTFEDLTDPRTAAPVVLAIRALKDSEDETSIVRSIDLYFVARGKWEVLDSKEFLDNISKPKDGDSKNEVVSKSGFLSGEEMKKRGLALDSTPDREMKFAYTTFSLLDQVELSATRLVVATRSKTALLGAAKLDSRFADDAEYPNRWRPIVRDADAEISFGKPHPYAGGGAYAKVTKLLAPADAIFVECHLVYEEPYGWFQGGEMLNSKLPTIVKSRVRVFRSKLGIAGAK
jgi:hypothetical protein